MASYKARSVELHSIAVELRENLERNINVSPGDQALLIALAVEVVNKMLYSFLISQEMFDNIDTLLNDHLDIKPEPHEVANLYLRVLGVVRELERHTAKWVTRYS
jgi:hypothetical protein